MIVFDEFFFFSYFFGFVDSIVIFSVGEVCSSSESVVSLLENFVKVRFKQKRKRVGFLECFSFFVKKVKCDNVNKNSNVDVYDK